MRFCDFFISYKIGLKGIKSTIPFTKLPLYRKIAVITIFVISMLSIILFICKFIKTGFIALLAELIAIAFFTILDYKERNLKTMLKDHYLPYSQKRMNMVMEVLHDYGITIHDFNSIDLLIEEARNAQIQSDYLALLKKPLKTLGAIIIPIVAYIAQKIETPFTQNEIITMAALAIAIVLIIFSIMLALSTIVKDILYHDYNKYSELIYDLRQIKLFYTKEDTISSN